jgi:acyl carrier protein
MASVFKTEAQMGIQPRLEIDPSFPARTVETCIRDALEAQLGAQAVLRPRVRSACDPEIDSLVVVEIICVIEETLGVTLPTSFAPRGGYESVEDCVSDLVAQTRAEWVQLVKEEQYHDGWARGICDARRRTGSGNARRTATYCA